MVQGSCYGSLSGWPWGGQQAQPLHTMMANLVGLNSLWCRTVCIFFFKHKLVCMGVKQKSKELLLHHSLSSHTAGIQKESLHARTAMWVIS